MNESLSNRQSAIAYLAASGRTVKEISESTGVTESGVRDCLNNENVVFEVKHLRYKLYGKGAKARFESMVDAGLDAVQEILENKNAKSQLRFQAAQEVFDRALGKPKQTIEHEGSILRSIYEQLSDPTHKTKEVIDVELPALENPNRVEIVQNEDNPNIILDTVDDWASKNL